MVREIKVFLGLCCLGLGFYIAGHSAITQPATTGMAAPVPSGNGTPDNTLICNDASANLMFIQLDATNGRLWLCSNGSGSYAWEHLITTVMGTATTGTITGGSFLLSGCTAIATVTISGAVVGTNAASASPIYASAPGGNAGLLNINAWVSAANTVSVQGCAAGIIGSIPNFQAKVLLY